MDYVLLNIFYIDFLLEINRTLKMLRANEVYVHVRVVLARVDLYHALCWSTRTVLNMDPM